jgi:hypothetical protein
MRCHGVADHKLRVKTMGKQRLLISGFHCIKLALKKIK